MAVLYHRGCPCLLPPTNKIACRCGSKTNNTRHGTPRCCTRSSLRLASGDPWSVSTSGRPNVGQNLPKDCAAAVSAIRTLDSCARSQDSKSGSKRTVHAMEGGVLLIYILHGCNYRLVEGSAQAPGRERAGAWLALVHKASDPAQLRIPAPPTDATRTAPSVARHLPRL